MLRDNTSRRRDVKSADVITFMLWQSVWFWRSCSSNIRVGLCYLCESFLSYSRLVVHVNYVTGRTSFITPALRCVEKMISGQTVGEVHIIAHVIYSFFKFIFYRLHITCKHGWETNRGREMKTYNGHTGATRGGSSAGGVRLAKPT